MHGFLLRTTVVAAVSGAFVIPAVMFAGPAGAAHSGTVNCAKQGSLSVSGSARCGPPLYLAPVSDAVAAR